MDEVFHKTRLNVDPLPCVECMELTTFRFQMKNGELVACCPSDCLGKRLGIA